MLYVEKNRQVNDMSHDAGEPLLINGSPRPAPPSALATQRLSVLGEMTGGIVHDFRNILSLIDSGLRLAESNLGDPDKVRTLITGAREGIARGVRLTSQIFNFAQQGEVTTCAADVNVLLKNLEMFLKYGAGPSVRIVHDYSPTLPKCLVERSQFAAAILNLVVNARDAMLSGGGEIRICTDRLQTIPECSGPGINSAYVQVRVQDNGSGMPDDVAQRAFDPFFTTKGDKGTGLGVPQVGAFMRRIGGHISISSEFGRGTTVDLFFPAIGPGTPLGYEDCANASDDLSVAYTDNRPLSTKNELMTVSNPAFLP